MEILKYRSFDGSAEIDMERKECHGKILYIDDVVTYRAKDPNGLQVEFELAVDDYIETCKAIGKEPQKPFRGLFNVRVSPELHRVAIGRAAIDGVTLNTIVGRALDSYLAAGKDVKSKDGYASSHSIEGGALLVAIYDLAATTSHVQLLVPPSGPGLKGTALFSAKPSTSFWSEFEMVQSEVASRPKVDHVH